MKAWEANNAADKFRDESLMRIYIKIDEASKKGLYSVLISGLDMDDVFYLRENGYQVGNENNMHRIEWYYPKS